MYSVQVISWSPGPAHLIDCTLGRLSADHQVQPFSVTEPLQVISWSTGPTPLIDCTVCRLSADHRIQSLSLTVQWAGFQLIDPHYVFGVSASLSHHQNHLHDDRDVIGTAMSRMPRRAEEGEEEDDWGQGSNSMIVLKQEKTFKQTLIWSEVVAYWHNIIAYRAERCRFHSIFQ